MGKIGNEMQIHGGGKKNENSTNKHDVDDDNSNEDGDNNVPLMALNHVSRVCRSVKDSLEFYTKVLGFVEIKRPDALDFDGAWLFNYGVGIHLVQSKDESKLPRKDRENLDPMDNHISFQVHFIFMLPTLAS